MEKKIDLDQYMTEENCRRLEQNQIKPYLENLNSKLMQLSEVLTREMDEFVSQYISVVKDTIECLKLKHELSGPDKVDFSLTIDPTYSGFPTVKDFYLLEKDKEQAKATLKILPGKKRIIDSLRDAVLKGKPATEAQIQLKRRRYYAKLKRTNLLKPYHLNEPKLVKVDKQKRKRYYTLEWSCIETGSNMPVFYRMYFTQNMSSSPLENTNAGLETYPMMTRYGMMNLRTIAQKIDIDNADIHPRLINKYIIGPYHNSVTKNCQELDDILEDEKESVLKFTVEAVASQYTRTNKTVWQKILGRVSEKEVFGPIDDSDRRMIAPFKIKQKLGDKDEHGKKCKIYAVTQDGGIIG